MDQQESGSNNVVAFSRRRVKIQVLDGGESAPEAGAQPAAHDLTLSDEQSQLVHRILQSYLSDLRMEIAGTDNPSMRRALHHEEDLLGELIPLFG